MLLSVTTGETEQQRNGCFASQDSAVFRHLRDKRHPFEENNVHILAREERWFERSVKEAIYAKLECLKHRTVTSNAILGSLRRLINSPSHLS